MGIFTHKVIGLVFLSLFPDSIAKLWLLSCSFVLSCLACSCFSLLLPDLPIMLYFPGLLCILLLLFVSYLLPLPCVHHKLFLNPFLSDITTVTDPPCSTVALRGCLWHVLGMCCLLALVHKEMNRNSFPFVKTQLLPFMSPVLQGGTWGWQWAAEVVV